MTCGVRARISGDTEKSGENINKPVVYDFSKNINIVQ